eukprot:354633-Chlamydomonas_euryale.AAC.4
MPERGSSNSNDLKQAVSTPLHECCETLLVHTRCSHPATRNSHPATESSHLATCSSHSATRIHTWPPAVHTWPPAVHTRPPAFTPGHPQRCVPMPRMWPRRSRTWLVGLSRLSRSRFVG